MHQWMNEDTIIMVIGGGIIAMIVVGMLLSPSKQPKWDHGRPQTLPPDDPIPPVAAKEVQPPLDLDFTDLSAERLPPMPKNTQQDTSDSAA